MVVISILQEYERIKNEIGNDRWNCIDAYINEHPELTFDKLVYNMFNWQKFDSWFNEHIRLQKVEILSVWPTDYDDIGCNATLYKNGVPVANVMESFDECTLRYVYGDSDSELTEELIRSSFESLINDSFDEYTKLPKISECSKLLTKVFTEVCASESCMCHITQEDWDDFYSDDFTEKDIDMLKAEVKRYGLEEVITFNEGEYKILGYSNLQYCFNDDRRINRNKESLSYEV